MFKAKSQSNQIKKVNNFSDKIIIVRRIKFVASFFPSRESVKSAYPLKNIRNFTFLRKEHLKEDNKDNMTQFTKALCNKELGSALFCSACLFLSLF